MLFGAVLATMFVLAVALAAGASLYGLQRYDAYARGVVPPEQLLAQLPRGGARVYDRNGILLYEFVDEFGHDPAGEDGLGDLRAVRDAEPLSQLRGRLGQFGIRQPLLTDHRRGPRQCRPAGGQGDPGRDPQPQSIVAQATVMDVNRQAWSSTTTLLVHPADL